MRTFNLTDKKNSKKKVELWTYPTKIRKITVLNFGKGEIFSSEENSDILKTSRFFLHKSLQNKKSLKSPTIFLKT